tara:strand:- start:746 stop:1231 length:486 start_codon:yes stop_codon:yes gene_type:complete
MDSHIGPSSVDLTLSSSFCCLSSSENEEILDIGEEPEFISWDSDFLVMHPNDFILASTEEFIEVPYDFAAFVAGRSSIGRIGIQVQNAGFIDSGFKGQVTLELQNQSHRSIRLNVGIRICQLIYMKMTSFCENPYNGKYQFQKGATFSKLYQDEEFLINQK